MKAPQTLGRSKGDCVFSRTHKSSDIGVKLRKAWSDVVTAPLPDNLRCLVEALSRAEKAEQQAKTEEGDAGAGGCDQE